RTQSGNSVTQEGLSSPHLRIRGEPSHAGLGRGTEAPATAETDVRAGTEEDQRRTEEALGGCASKDEIGQRTAGSASVIMKPEFENIAARSSSRKPSEPARNIVRILS